MHTNEDDLAFLEAIRQAPYDDAPRLVYADWLEERDDARAEYIRKMYEIIGHIRAGTSYDHLDLAFRELAKQCMWGWRATVSKGFDVVFDACISDLKLWSIKKVRETMGLPLAEAKSFVETAPRLLREHIPLESALTFRSEFAYYQIPKRVDLQLPVGLSILLRERQELTDENVINNLIEEYDRTKQILPLSQLLYCVKKERVHRFLIDLATISANPALIREFLWASLAFTRRENGENQTEITITALQLTQNQEESEALRRETLRHLIWANTDRRFDNAFVGLLQDHTQPLSIRIEALGGLMSNREENQQIRMEPFLLDLILDVHENDWIRHRAFNELTRLPCEHLHATFRGLDAGENLSRSIVSYFEELEGS